VVEAKRKPPDQIRKEVTPRKGARILKTISCQILLILHPVGVRLFCVTGGLRFAATTGYFRATLRVTSLTSNLNSWVTTGKWKTFSLIFFRSSSLHYLRTI